MRVVDGHYAVMHGSPPDAVAAFPSAEAIVRAIGQIEVHGVASRIAVEVVEDQARAFQRGPAQPCSGFVDFACAALAAPSGPYCRRSRSND